MPVCLNERLGNRTLPPQSRMDIGTQINRMSAEITEVEDVFWPDSKVRELKGHCAAVAQHNVSAEGITLDIDGEKYSWSQFIRNVNKRILAITESEDKQIGNYFVNPKDKVVKADLFVNKVMFYLWSDVFKEEDQMDENNIFSRKDENGETVHVSYSELFSGNSEDADMIKSLLAFNSVDKIP